MQFENPLLRGYFGAQQAGDARTMGQIQNFGGMLNLQNSMRAQQEQGLLREAVVMGPDGQLDPTKTLANIYRINPQMGLQFQTALQKDSQFGKVDPKDYTSESVARFAQSRNYADLVPVRKLEYIDTGSAKIPVDPYTNRPGGMPIPVSVSPDKSATLAQNDRHWSGFSAAESARIGLSSDEHFYNTGRTPLLMGPPANAPVVGPRSNAPTIPTMMGPQEINRFAPQASAVLNPGLAATQARVTSAETQPNGGGMIPSSTILPPKMQNEIAAAAEKQRAELAGKREYNMGGINAALNEAERILKGEGPVVNGVRTRGQVPTGSLIGAAQDATFAAFGANRAGAKEADQLRAIGGALVSKMPRMEGPQSDRDVAMYREMAGEVGNDRLPVERRLAALKTVRDLHAKYERGGEVPSGAAGLSGSDLDVFKRADAIIGRR